MAKKKKQQGEGSVFLRKDGRWEGRIVVDYKDNGNPITKNVTAKTEVECREKLEKLKKEVAHLIGRLPKKAKPDMAKYEISKKMEKEKLKKRTK